MIYFLALIPATVLTVAGYFVFFLSNRSEGTFQRFGRFLGFWAFTLAGLVILGAIFAAARGHHNRAMLGMRDMHGHMHGPWMHEPRFLGSRPDDFHPGAPPPAPGAANPAAPTGPASPSTH
jgi:hypothetical protein